MNKFLSDKIKFLSFALIILVVFIHAYTFKKGSSYGIIFQKGYLWEIETFISDGITRIAVPLFFLLSGYLYFLNYNNSKKEIAEKFKKRAKTLLLPYLLWSVSAFLFYFAIEEVPKIRKFFSNELVINYSFAKVLNTIFLNPINFQLWFLRDLMFLVILTPVIYYLIKYIKWVLFILPLFLWLFDIRLQVLSTESLLYFLLGAYLAFNKVDLYFRSLSAWAYYLFTMWILAIILRIVLVELKLINVTENILLYKLAIILGLAAVWGLYDRLIKNKDITNLKVYKILSFSFFIYLFHEPLLTVIQKIMFAAAGKAMAVVLIIYFSSAIIAIFMCLIFGYVFKRYLPLAYALCTGNR